MHRKGKTKDRKTQEEKSCQIKAGRAGEIRERDWKSGKEMDAVGLRD